jgi:ribA/ribD-fused uncharacterized protein
MILYFRNNFSFLSNFYEHPFELDGHVYKTAEHAYQSYKTLDEEERDWIRNLPDPKTAKLFGSRIKIRKDWDEVKDKIMLYIIRSKFSDKYMSDLLLNTGDEELVEGNYWHDNYWGNCTCSKCKDIEGQNKLGKILMKVRDEIRMVSN